MMTLTFEQSVEIAKHIIAPHLIGPGEIDRTTLTGLAAWRAAQCDTTKDAGYSEFRAEHYGASMLLTSPERLIEAAETDYFSFLALTRSVANVLELGWPIPRSVQLWLSSSLRGETNPPIRPNHKTRKDVRHFKIFCAVQFLVLQGLKPTRSKASVSGETACDAVAKAHKELGMAPRSYGQVLDVYYLEKRSAGPADIILSPNLSEIVHSISGTTS